MKTALFSDVHGNSPALAAVLDDIRREGVERVFMLGDIINGMDPSGCLNLLGEWRDRQSITLTCIQGNAEMYLLTPDLDELPDRGESWEKGVLDLIRWFQARLSAAQLAFIATFPPYLEVDGLCLVHDSPAERLRPERWHKPGIPLKYQEWFYHGRGISEAMPEAEWQALLALMEDRQLRAVFCGHTHRAFLRQLGERIVCNCGSVGAPLDGDPRAAWVLLEDTPGRPPAVAIRRVEYNLDAILRLVDAAVDYPDFERPGERERYKRWRLTGSYQK